MLSLGGRLSRRAVMLLHVILEITDEKRLRRAFNVEDHLAIWECNGQYRAEAHQKQAKRAEVLARGPHWRWPESWKAKPLGGDCQS